MKVIEKCRYLTSRENCPRLFLFPLFVVIIIIVIRLVLLGVGDPDHVALVSAHWCRPLEAEEGVSVGVEAAQTRESLYQGLFH